MEILRKVTESIKRHRLLSNGEAVLVAVSGGPDSVALLHILNGLREELGFHLEVAHLHHGIRGEEAKEDARFVAAMAERLGKGTWSNWPEASGIASLSRSHGNETSTKWRRRTRWMIKPRPC